MNARTIVMIAAFSGMIGVALGAFGAHGLAEILEANQRSDTFRTANQYQMAHTLALLALGFAPERLHGIWTRRAAWLFVGGMLLFSGALYALAILNVGFFGAVAPLGGAALIAGWACIGMAARRMN